MSLDEKLLYRGTPSQKKNTFLFIGYGAIFFLILPLILLIYKYLETKSIKYELTTQRLRLTRGILNKTISDLELYRIKDYKIHQPFVYRIFGISKIELDTSDKSHPIVILDGVKDATELLNMIRHNVENMRLLKRVSAVDFAS